MNKIIDIPVANPRIEKALSKLIPKNVKWNVSILRSGLKYFNKITVNGVYIILPNPLSLKDLWEAINNECYFHGISIQETKNDFIIKMMEDPNIKNYKPPSYNLWSWAATHLDIASLTMGTVYYPSINNSIISINGGDH